MANVFKIKNEVLARIYVVLGLLVLTALIIFFKVVNVGVIERNTWTAKRDTLYIDKRELPSERGDILAADGSVLASSQQYADVFFDATLCNEKTFTDGVDTLAWCLHTYVDGSYSPQAYKNWLLSNRAAGNKFMKIKDKASPDLLEKIKLFPIFREGRNRGGLIINKNDNRKLPFGEMARRTIGTRLQNQSYTGIEGAFDRYLEGQDGEDFMTKTTGDVWLPMGDFTQIDPIRGYDVLSTIDISIQDVTHQALKQAIKNHQAEWGCAVVMDVKTGAIVAMSNLARKDTMIFEDINHAVIDAIEPGSTFKTATMLALLDENLVELNDSIDLEKGYLKIHNIDLHDSEPHGLNWTTVSNAFAKSSNVGMAKLAMKYFGTPERSGFFSRKLKSFGLDQISEVDLDGEAKPILKDPTSPDWSGTTLPWMSFGYEVANTPLQLITFYNGIANNGRMMKPQLVRALQKDGQVKKLFRPEVLRSHLASRPAIEKIKTLLTEVIRTGTGKDLYTDVYEIAGKTGTTQLNYERMIRNNVRIGGYRASFAGFFPVENPQYSCIVVVNRPSQGGFYGGSVAGPVFRRIADRIMATKPQTAALVNYQTKPILMPGSMPKQSGGWMQDFRSIFKILGIRALPIAKSDWATVQADTNRVFIIDRTVRPNMVPNVVGMGLRDALFLLENAGLKVRISGHGKVVRQSLSPGQKSNGQTIGIALQ